MVGAYPYEYASIDEVESLVNQLGFRTVKKVPAQVPTDVMSLFLEKQIKSNSKFPLGEEQQADQMAFLWNLWVLNSWNLAEK